MNRPFSLGKPIDDRRYRHVVSDLRPTNRLGIIELAAVERLLGEPREVRARTEIVREGERSNTIHVLLDGWASRALLLPTGERQFTALLIPGDICDLDALYLEGVGPAVFTLTSCTVAPIERAALRQLASREPTVAEALGRLVAVEGRMLAERNLCLGRRSARGHLTHLLCELFVRLSAAGLVRENGFTLPITQEEIADVLGLTAVHVNRVLQSLRAGGLIAQRGRTVFVLEWDMLRREAGFASDYLHLDAMIRNAADVAATATA